jgi:hypothetical protein
MTNPNKAKGTRFESEVVNYLREAGLPAVKPRQEGNEDVGDIHVGEFVIQCKNWADVQAATRAGLDGAERQAAARAKRVGMPWRLYVPVVAVKRARRPTGETFITMTLDTFVRLAQDYLN